LVVFGHIHMHQTVGGKIVYAGAPERIDWGERLDPKGFLTIRPEGDWSFVELPARPMDKVETAVGMGDDVTEKVLAALPPDVRGPGGLHPRGDRDARLHAVPRDDGPASSVPGEVHGDHGPDRGGEVLDPRRDHLRLVRQDDADGHPEREAGRHLPAEWVCPRR